MKLAGLLLITVAGLYAAPPVIRDVAPRGGRPGSVVKLVLKGADLPSGARLETSVPASVSRLSPPAETMRPGTELAFLVELKKDAREGIYPLRVVAPSGVSNVMLFAVEDLPAIEETEATQSTQRNDDVKTAQSLPLPGAVDGKLGGGSSSPGKRRRPDSRNSGCQRTPGGEE